jgi:hypothetical protein
VARDALCVDPADRGSPVAGRTVTRSATVLDNRLTFRSVWIILPLFAPIVRTLLAIFAVIIVVLTLVFVRLQSETGPTALERCRAAAGQAKSWTIESISQPQSPNFVTITNRTRISCPDDYEYFNRSRTPDNVIKEQSTVHTNGETYVENVDGSWAKSTDAGDSPGLKECGKGPALIQSTVVNAIFELPRRKAGSIVKGQRQTVNGAKCQEWHVEYGNEWPQTAPYTVCIDLKTHLPLRITFTESGVTNEFTGWNVTKIEPPAL